MYKTPISLHIPCSTTFDLSCYEQFPEVWLLSSKPELLVHARAALRKPASLQGKLLEQDVTQDALSQQLAQR